MIDRDFFDVHLSRHVADKAKHSGEAAASVRLRLTTGEKFSVITFIEATEGYAVVEVYPEDGKLRKSPKEERDQGAPQFDLDRLVVPYHMIADVLITTRRPKNQKSGFSPRTDEAAVSSRPPLARKP